MGADILRLSKVHGVAKTSVLLLSSQRHPVTLRIIQLGSRDVYATRWTHAFENVRKSEVCRACRGLHPRNSGRMEFSQGQKKRHSMVWTLQRRK